MQHQASHSSSARLRLREAFRVLPNLQAPVQASLCTGPKGTFQLLKGTRLGRACSRAGHIWRTGSRQHGGSTCVAFRQGNSVEQQKNSPCR